MPPSGGGAVGDLSSALAGKGEGEGGNATRVAARLKWEQSARFYGSAKGKGAKSATPYDGPRA